MSELLGAPHVLCACPTGLTSEEQTAAEALLSEYFPAEATFEFVWPTGPIAGLEPAEWFANLVEEQCSGIRPVRVLRRNT